jgi:putative MATE family efflux protein
MNTATELGTGNIATLLRKYAIPSIIAMTASSLYNMVDSIFIGQGVGAYAISGLAVTFPFMNLSAAFGAMVGVGASTLISVRLGQRDYATAQKVLGNVLVLNVVIGLIFTIISLLFLDEILYFFGASDNTIGYARDYMEIILLGNVITHIYLGLNAVMRASGHPRRSMYATIFTVVLNTILDPLFIFVFDWGIKGAAIATILAQALALCWQIYLFSDQKELLHFHRGIYRLKSKIVKETLTIGLAPFMMNTAACFIVILVNNTLYRYEGDLAIGAYGIINRLAFLFLMVMMGLNQGMQPIAGYNYGAQRIDRLFKVFRLTATCAITVSTAGFLMAMLIPRVAVGVFTNDESLTELSVFGLQVSMAAFPVIGYQIVTSNFFQSIGMAGKAILLSLTRQVIFLIPLLIILPHLWGVTGVWAAQSVSDFLAFLMAVFMMRHQIKAFKKQGYSIN